jgi:poly(A) polymerase/tRNA nucleotidyltransferase (CCA-adding enzyme)
MKKTLTSDEKKRLQGSVPEGVRRILDWARAARGRVVVVGGSVRDLLLDRPGNDWDLATDLTPDRMREAFPRTIDAGSRFGTLLVPSGGGVFEVTTFRREEGYSDLRHPDRVHFTTSLEVDLARRDFTVNAMAWDPSDPESLIDPHGGAQDLQGRIIRAVGSPADRFAEDALRILRAVRLAAQLGFTLEAQTLAAMRESAARVESLSGERVRDEFNKLLTAPSPSWGFQTLLEIGVLEILLPELVVCAGVTQNRFHAYDVFEHTLAATDKAPEENLVVRLATLFHDIGKPATRTEEDGEVHFYGHQFVSEKRADGIMRRLKYSNEERRKVKHLVRHHMFFYQPEWTDSAVRRFIREVGLESVSDLFALRKADTAGSGKTRADASGKLQELWDRVQRVLEKDNAFSVRDLAVGGKDVMEALGVGPGPVVGDALNHLLERVLEDPDTNTREGLLAELARWGASRVGTP